MRFLWVMVMTLFITACSSTPEIERPAELVKLSSPVVANIIWSKSLLPAEEPLSSLVEDDRVYSVAAKGVVWALDRAKGRKIWKTKTNANISGALGAGPGLLLAGTREGEVLALNKEDGTPKWRASVSSEVLVAPVAVANVVVARAIDGKIFALDATSGKRLWMFERSVPLLSLRGGSVPVLTDRYAVVGLASGEVVALNLADGRVLWEAAVALPHGRSELERMVDIVANPVLRDEVIYAVSYQGRVAALSSQTGQIFWARDMSSHTGLAVGSGVVYLSDDKGHIWALDQDSGAALWKQEKLHGRVTTAPVLYQDYVVVGDFEGYLHWLDQEDGDLVARYRVDEEAIAAPPVVKGDMLYAAGMGGSLKAIRLTSSK